MLHGIIEQGNFIDARDDNSEKYYFSDLFSYKPLASSAVILGIIVIADNKPMDL